MNRKYFFSFFLLIGFSLAIVQVALAEKKTATSKPAAAVEDGIAVYFSPYGGYTDAVVKELDQAKISIKVQAYYFTTPKIAKAVVDAFKRGLVVTVILDHSQ